MCHWGEWKRTNELILTPIHLHTYSHIFYQNQSKGLASTRKPCFIFIPSREEASRLWSVWCLHSWQVRLYPWSCSAEQQHVHGCDISWQQRGALTYVIEVAVGSPFWAVSAFQGAWLWKGRVQVGAAATLSKWSMQTHTEGAHTLRVWLPSRLLEMVETLHWATVW